MGKLLRFRVNKLRRWFLVVVIAATPVFGALRECRARSVDNVEVKEAGRITVANVDWLTLQDVDDRGRVLVIDNSVLASTKSGPGVLSAQPILLIWDLARQVFSYRLPLDLTVPRGSALAKSWPWIFEIAPRQFQFLANGDVVGTVGCYVVRLDLAKGKANWILPSPDACEPHPPYFAGRNVTSRAAVLSMDRPREEFAVGVNVGKWPWLFVFGPDGDKPIANWRLDRPVWSLAWSPDGSRLAALYDSRFDAQLKYFWKVGYWHLPNLVVFDAPSGKQEFSVFTGRAESHVEFSRDGSLLYCIAQQLYWGLLGGEGEGIKVFDASDGKEVRSFKGGRHGIGQNFSLSPDGKLIVADASTQPFTWEGATIDKIGRFVILDSASGRVVFDQPGRRMHGSARALPYEFAFTPDGLTLIVDPWTSWGIPGSFAIDVYSLNTK
jgi:WD40 repeat protein